MVQVMAFVLLVIICQFGLSVGACAECSCCKEGGHDCDENKKCISGCIDGFYGEMCTEKCLENCKTCDNGTECMVCSRGYYSNKCTSRCGKGCLDKTCSLISGECDCKSSNFSMGKCDVCSDNLYGPECNITCPSTCGSCKSETQCSWCKNNVFYGQNCQHRCSYGCDGGRCKKNTGICNSGCKSNYVGNKCDVCSPGIYGKYCDLYCSENCFACNSRINCTACKSGFYGETCSNTCPSGCSSNCSFHDGRCFECKSGFSGTFCVPESKPLITIAASAGSGGGIIILVIVLIVCLVKRNQSLKTSSNIKNEENNHAQDLQKTLNQSDRDERDILSIRASKPKQEAVGYANKDNVSKINDEMNISVIDNGFTVINLNTGKSEKEKRKSLEIYDAANVNESDKPVNDDKVYAVVNKGKRAMKKNEINEEVYDTTHDNKKIKKPLNSNNEYAVFCRISDSKTEIGKSNETLSDNEHNVYDTTKGKKFEIKTLLPKSNDYAVFAYNNTEIT